MQLILYGKKDCDLCDRLDGLLHPHIAGRDIAVIKRDIETNQELLKQYRYRIPVLTYEDRVILEGRPERDEIARVLADL